MREIARMHRAGRTETGIRYSPQLASTSARGAAAAAPAAPVHEPRMPPAGACPEARARPRRRLPAPLGLSPHTCPCSSEITALSKQRIAARCPLFRVGVRPRTCAAGGDDVWCMGRAICVVEKGLGGCQE